MSSTQESKDSGLPDAVIETARQLFRRYIDYRPHIVLKRDLSECLQSERRKMDELRRLYSGALRHVRFLSPEYLQHYSRFERHQDIPEKYIVRGASDFIFVSHRWETADNPDPTARQFETFKTYFDRLPADEKEGCALWYDFSCIPQQDSEGKRSADEEAVFADTLKVMHLLPTLSLTTILFDFEYVNRSWCMYEFICSTRIYPLLLGKDEIFPMGNVLKFRQIALVVLFLKMSDEMAAEFFDGEDRHAIGFINSLMHHLLQSTNSTYGSDKAFLLYSLHRQWWYHVRFLGLRSQLLTAFAILERFDERWIEIWLAQFLYISGDPTAKWTEYLTLETETLFSDGRDTFDDIAFHGHTIEVRSRSTHTS